MISLARFLSLWTHHYVLSFHVHLQSNSSFVSQSVSQSVDVSVWLYHFFLDEMKHDHLTGAPCVIETDFNSPFSACISSWFVLSFHLVCFWVLEIEVPQTNKMAVFLPSGQNIKSRKEHTRRRRHSGLSNFCHCPTSCRCCCCFKLSLSLLSLSLCRTEMYCGIASTGGILDTNFKTKGPLFALTSLLRPWVRCGCVRACVRGHSGVRWLLPIFGLGLAEMLDGMEKGGGMVWFGCCPDHLHG